MNKTKSDIEIAREAKIKPIVEVLKKFNVPDDPFVFSPMGLILDALAISISDFTLLIPS